MINVQRELMYAAQSRALMHGEKTEDELLQRIWNLADVVIKSCDYLDETRRNYEKLEKELRDCTRFGAAVIHKLSGENGSVLLYPSDLEVDYLLTRYDNPAAGTVHLYARRSTSHKRST